MSLEQEDLQFRELTEFDANSVLMQITTNEIGYESSTEPLLKRGLHQTFRDPAIIEA